MKEMILNLDISQQRPVVLLSNNLMALLDTGAFVPVWTDDEELLKKLYNAEFVKSDVPLSGFGGTTKGNLYKATMTIGDLIYPNMHIIANSELNTSFSMIISATMFSGLIYEIDTKNHKLNITIPNDESRIRNLRIQDSNGKLHVLCSSAEEA